MTTMIAEIYDALREAGASEGKSRAAAEALSAYDDQFGSIDRRFDSLDRRIDQVENGLERKIDALRSEMNQKFERVDGRFNLLQWQLAILIGGVVALVIKAFIAPHVG